MTYVVRINCGGYRKSFLLSRGVSKPNGDIEPGPVQIFDTEADARKAGENSACVQTMGWSFDVEQAK